MPFRKIEIGSKACYLEGRQHDPLDVIELSGVTYFVSEDLHELSHETHPNANLTDCKSKI